MSAHAPAANPANRRVRIGLADAQTLEIVESGGDERTATASFRTLITEPPTPDRLRFQRVADIELEVSSLAHDTQGIAVLRTVSGALYGSGISRCKLRCDTTQPRDEIAKLATHVGLLFSEADAAFTIPDAVPPAAEKASPLVSVVVAGYNPRYLAAALASVAQQTWTHWELIVCDDHRGDAVRAIVEAFARRTHQPVRYFRNETALGVRRNYERCFREARGDYVKYLNDDDLLDANCIERLTLALERSPSAHLATSHRRRIDERGFPLSDQPATTPVFRSDVYIDGLSLINTLVMLGLNFVGEPSTALIRRRAAVLANEDLISFLELPGRGLADMTMWLRLALRGDCVFLADRLSSFRIHNEQQTVATTVSQFALTTIPAFRERWLRYAFYERIPANLLRTLPYHESSSAETYSEASWQLSPVPLFTPPNANLQQLVADWRAKKHPFFERESRV
jgi:glycosyltransferase involved in cell wall biosynthesis